MPMLDLCGSKREEAGGVTAVKLWCSEVPVEEIIIWGESYHVVLRAAADWLEAHESYVVDAIKLSFNMEACDVNAFGLLLYAHDEGE